ncbi:MAG: hypothetical protein JWM16_3995, partial [Verrucomicrobiales bacterium]|nr:hypothetical protein [Verrucomicrobiales bacterium]
SEPEPSQKRAPTLYAIIGVKLLKGALLLAAAITAYTLSDNDLPAEFKHFLKILGQDPQRKFFEGIAQKIATVTEANVLWVAAGTFVYSLFSWVEGIGLIMRVGWAGWMAVLESAFFIPIELYELEEKGFTWGVSVILVLNVIIVTYLVKNRHRLFHHHIHSSPAVEKPLSEPGTEAKIADSSNFSPK